MGTVFNVKTGTEVSRGESLFGAADTAAAARDRETR